MLSVCIISVTLLSRPSGEPVGIQSPSVLNHTEVQGTMEESEDIYSDVDSEDFVQDMRSYGVAQALPLDVRPPDVSLTAQP